MLVTLNQLSQQFSKQDQYFKTFRQNVRPPNQIITKNYQPDLKPIMKLLSTQQQGKNQLLKHNGDENSRLQELLKCDFQEDDSLGYYYVSKIKSNSKLVYMKLKNYFNFKCPQNNFKYLAGFFVPLNQLLIPEIKCLKNLYKALQSKSQHQSIQFCDYQNMIENSFKQNCSSTDSEVKFSSNYESSNLFMAIKTGCFQYDLILQNDINSKGTTQWFNFAVQIPEPGTFKFNIVNLTKSHSLFQKGMKVPYFSYQNNLLNNTSWTRGCQNISYFKSQVNREGSTESYYYTLHFEYQNTYKSDVVIFSYCFPYTGLEIDKFFNKISHKKLSINLKIQKIKICQTLSGLPIYVYHISPKKTFSSLHNFHRTHLSLIQNKSSPHVSAAKGIVLFSRQHSGESQSSFILEGIIDFLLQNNQYDNSKKNYHYYIFPLVNADGVFYGNYRTNLSGNDLNRVWKQPRKDFHPQVYWIKKYLINANRLTQLKLIIDIHGHSSALNSFFYGNPTKKEGGPQQIQNPKLFPFYCSKQIKQISFPQCTFNISQDKKSSARVILNQMFPKASVYTLQNSFYGYRKGKRIVQYSIERYKKLGRKLISSYFQYNKIIQRIPLIKQKWQKQIQCLYQNLRKTVSINQNHSESDSQASQQLIQFEEEYQKIDKQSLLFGKSSENEDFDQNKREWNQKMFSFNSNSRLYQRKRSKYNFTGSQEENQKGYNAIYFQDNLNASELNFAAQQGFLSIVKIQTKKSLVDRKDKSSNQSSMIKQLNNEIDQDGDKQNIKTIPVISASTNIVKSPLNASKTLKYFKKQYTVQSIKHQNSLNNSIILSKHFQKKEIKYINQKQFLMKRRKSINQGSIQSKNGLQEKILSLNSKQNQKTTQKIGSSLQSSNLKACADISNSYIPKYFMKQCFTKY